MTMMDEYAEAAHHGKTADLDPAEMTDREIAIETLLTLRRLANVIETTAAQIGPAFASIQSNPILGRMLGGR